MGKRSRNNLNRISRDILLCAIDVHKELGPGLLESVYEYCLIEELKAKGYSVENQVYLPIFYKGKALSKDFRIDLRVEGEIIIEIKALDVVLPVHYSQVVSYLKLSDLHLGFLINFNVPVLKSGFRRFVNDF